MGVPPVRFIFKAGGTLYFQSRRDAYLTRIIFKLCNAGKEGKALHIDCQMAFDARSAFVVTKLFGVHTRSAGIFHRLRVND